MCAKVGSKKNKIYDKHWFFFMNEIFLCKSLNDASTDDADRAAMWVDRSTDQRHAISKVKEKSIELQK
jgi:hypothetical protein